MFALERFIGLKLHKVLIYCRVGGCWWDAGGRRARLVSLRERLGNGCSGVAVTSAYVVYHYSELFGGRIEVVDDGDGGEHTELARDDPRDASPEGSGRRSLVPGGGGLLARRAHGRDSRGWIHFRTRFVGNRVGQGSNFCRGRIREGVTTSGRDEQELEIDIAVAARAKFW